jgi:hypothetical protein
LEGSNGKNALPRRASRPKLLSQYLFLGMLPRLHTCLPVANLQVLMTKVPPLHYHVSVRCGPISR